MLEVVVPFVTTYDSLHTLKVTKIRFPQHRMVIEKPVTSAAYCSCMNINIHVNIPQFTS